MTEQVESLWGKLDLKEMGIRASREPAPTKPAKTPKTALARDARSAVEYVTAVVAGALDDQPTAIIDSAVEEVVRVFKGQASESDKRRQLNELLQITIDDDRFIQLANLIAKMGTFDVDFGKTVTGQDGTVAIEFDEEESEDDLIGVIEEVEEDEVEGASVVEEREEGVHGRKKVNLDALSFPLGSHTMTNERCVLPEATKRINMPGYEEIHVPAPEAFVCDDNELRTIESLPQYYHAAFTSVTRLNYIQSRVADAVINSDSNILLCAPTGAGKTNVALMSIVKEMAKFDKLDSFKAVYIAPMKALVQEMVRNFTTRLQPYGVKVAELTGDAQSTRQELGDAHIIIATPEKWDVVSRKANDLSFTRLVRLVIIDEIHLLHDERGPVLESIVMRLLSDQQTTGDYVRIVGLSATLPNYVDVARFIHATPSTTFMFDGRHRPVPLEQVFVGLTERKPLKRVEVMNDVCYRLCLERAGQQQTLVFVHSRKDTVKTAKMIIEKAIEEKTIGRFLGDADFDSDSEGKVESADLKQIMKYNVGVHHAGMTRGDRLLVEQSFAEGRLQLLVSTATLAWGVNLPAHTVIIKGTQVYRPDRSEWCELSGQDVLQMLGRAGRPQYDTVGEGIIITEHQELPFYMSLSTMQLPIESQMIAKVGDHLNAAVCYGMVKSLPEAVLWLSKSYLAVRMAESPKNYGCHGTNTITDTIEDICHSALCQLAKGRLVEYDRGDWSITPTDLGKIASDYYLPASTAATFNEHLANGAHSEVDLLRIFSLAAEFKAMAVRREEHFEIAKLIDRVPIPVREAPEDRLAKVNVLLQSFISQWPLAGFALQADTMYVTQSAARLFRAMFAIAVSKARYKAIRTLLDLCKSVDRRQWYLMSPLRQTDLPLDVVVRMERREFPFERLFDLTPEELGDLVRMPSAGADIAGALRAFPRVKLVADCVPMSADEMEIEISVEPLGRENGQHARQQSELYWVFVQDPNHPTGLLCHDTVIFTARSGNRTTVKRMRCPMTASPVIYVDVVSDRWIGAEARLPVALLNMTVPKRQPPLMTLRDVKLVGGMDVVECNAWQAVERVFVGGQSAFVCAPKDLTALLGKAVGESDGQRVLWLHPCEDHLKVMQATDCFVLTGDPQVDWAMMEKGELVVGTYKAFEVISRRWKSKKPLQNIDIIILQDTHLISQQHHEHVDVLLSRLKMLRSLVTVVKFQILATSLPTNTAYDFSEWLLGPEALCLPFDVNCRALDVQVAGMPQQHLPSLVLAGSRLCLAGGDGGVLVFVDGVRQAKQTALDLTALLGSGGVDSGDVNVDDKVLMETVPIGIAYLHESMSAGDQNMVISAFKTRQISHLVMSRESIWSFTTANLTASRVCILGTSTFEPQHNALVEYGDADVSRMLLFAGNTALIVTQKWQVKHYEQAVKAPLTCESSLRTAANLVDHLNTAIANRSVQCRQDAVDLLTWTFMYRRVPDNPNYYGMMLASEDGGQSVNFAISAHLSELVEESLEALVEARCVQVQSSQDAISATNLGLIAAHYGTAIPSIDMFALSVRRGTKLKGVLELVAACQEFDGLTVRHKERHLLAQIADAVPIQPSADKPSDDPHTKAHLLLQAHFSRLSLPPTLRTDQQKVVQCAYLLAQALFDVCASHGLLGTACAAADFCQMLVMAVWDYQHPMLCIPNVTPELVQLLVETGVKNVYDFVDLQDDTAKTQYLQQCGGKAQQRQAIQALNRYPSVSVSVSCEGESVQVAIESDLEEGPIIAPFFPCASGKHDQWWVVLGDDQDQVVAVKKVRLTEERHEVLFDGVRGATRVLLLNDAYVGCDQEVTIN